MATDGASPSSSSLGATTLRDTQSSTRSGTERLSDLSKGTSKVVVRFYLIRHGETEANLRGLVLGQTDSVRTQHVEFISYLLCATVRVSYLCPSIICVAPQHLGRTTGSSVGSFERD